MFILSRTNFSFLLISSSASVAGRTAATPSARKRSDSAGPRSWPASPPHAVVAEREPEGASVNERCRVAASVHNAKLIRRHSHTQTHTHSALARRHPHRWCASRRGMYHTIPSFFGGAAFGGASFILAFMFSTASPSPPTFASSAIVCKLGFRRF